MDNRDEGKRYQFIRNSLFHDELFQEETNTVWRLGREPFPLSTTDIRFFEQLGHHLLEFSKSLNRLYLESVKGQQPRWIHEYFDQGKPEALLSFARMKRFRNLVPDVIRPDILPTEEGMVMTELDSVPGGIGLNRKSGSSIC